MKNDLRYSPSLCFLPFPLPSSFGKGDLYRLGREYAEARSKFTKNLDIGLTGFYKLFHDPEKNGKDIVEFRELHKRIDEAVSESYGWIDLDLEHEFHEVGYLPENDNVRFTISEKARIEVLRRLAQLNKERYEEEVAQGLHPNAKGTKKKAPSKKKRSTAMVYDIPSYSEREIRKAAEPDSPQMDIFADPPDTPEPFTSGNQWGSEPIDQVLAWLEAHAGWHGKREIITGCGIQEAEWKKAIDYLLEEGFVERRGERRGAKYRAIQD